MAKKTRKLARTKTAGLAPAVRLRRDEVGALLRAEIVRQNALERSREPLALIAETAIHYPDGGAGPGYVIVDASGAPRTRILRGKTVPLTIANLVAELRREHPNLFGPQPGAGAALTAGPADRFGADGLTGHLPAAASLQVFARDYDIPSPDAPPESATPLTSGVVTPEIEADVTGPASLASSEPARSADATPPGAARARDWIRLGENAPLEPPRSPLPDAPTTSSSPAAVPAADNLSDVKSPPPAAAPPSVAPLPPPRGIVRRYREPVAIRPEPAVPKPRLAGAWRPSRLVMRVLYVAAFVGGMAAYSAVRHLS